jgi:hypothetical protein
VRVCDAVDLIACDIFQRAYRAQVPLTLAAIE